MGWVVLTLYTSNLRCRFSLKLHCTIERYFALCSSLTVTLSSDTASWLWVSPFSSQGRMVSFSTVDWTPTTRFSLTSSTLWQGVSVCVCDSQSMLWMQDGFWFCVISLRGCRPSWGRTSCENRTGSLRGLLVSISIKDTSVLQRLGVSEES